MPLKFQKHVRYTFFLLNKHLWSKYAKLHATYEAAPISDVARIAVHSDGDDHDDNDEERRKRRQCPIHILSFLKFSRCC